MRARGRRGLELVELREAEELRRLHDDRVDVWDVDAILEDRRCDEDVRLAEREVDDALLEPRDARNKVDDDVRG